MLNPVTLHHKVLGGHLTTGSRGLSIAKDDAQPNMTDCPVEF